MKGIGEFLKRSPPTILTCAGGLGIIATAVLAVKATPKAIRLLEMARDEKKEDLTKFEVVKIAGPEYVPAALIGLATVTCIFGANVLNKKQQAAVVSAYMLAENAYKEYSGKVKAMLGKEAESKVREAMAADDFDGSDAAVSPADDTVLFYDMTHNRYFESPLDVTKLDTGLECLIVEVPPII